MYCLCILDRNICKNMTIDFCAKFVPKSEEQQLHSSPTANLLMFLQFLKLHVGTFFDCSLVLTVKWPWKADNFSNQFNTWKETNFHTYVTTCVFFNYSKVRKSNPSPSPAGLVVKGTAASVYFCLKIVLFVKP